MKKLLKNKKFVKITCFSILLVTVIVFVASGGMYYVYNFLFNPDRGTVSEPVPTLELSALLTKEEAIEDIDYILKRLETRHPAAMRGLPEDVIEQSRIEKEGFAEEVTVLQLWQAAARILALMNDAHTDIAPYTEYMHFYLPSSYYRFTDGSLYYALGELAGSLVISISGVPVEDLHRTYISQTPYELREYADYMFTHSVRWKEYLLFMNADVSETVTVVFETPDGEVNSEEYSFYAWKPPEEDESAFVSFEIDKENSIGIFTLTACKNNDIYREKLKEFFTEVKAHEIQAIVVDLRRNGGGNSCTVYEFVRYLDVDYYDFGRDYRRMGPVLWDFGESRIKNEKADDLIFSGDVYVLTSPRTFSAAVIFTAVVSLNELGKIVGETSGQPPSFYTGALMFQTPNAKLYFGISQGYVRGPCESEAYQPLFPDYPVPAGEALEKVYQLLQQED
jgi:hypothetical protein